MRSQAIILKTIPIKEHDQLIVCYTSDSGKQLYNAKSSLLRHSKQGPHLQVLNHIDFSLVKGNGHPIITSAYAIDTFTKIKSSLNALAISYFFLECFDKLVFDNEPDEKLWNFLLNALNRFNILTDDNKTDWRKILKEEYELLMNTMGYTGDTQVQELHHTQFASIHFIDSVLQ